MGQRVMRRLTVSALVALAFVCGSASAKPIRGERPISQLSRDLANMLRCSDRPQPAKLIVRLARQGYVSRKMDFGADGISCFHLLRPLALPAADDPHAKLIPKAICAADDSAHAAPLFWRGPGTLPPNTVEIYVDAAPSDIEAWMRENGADQRARLLDYKDGAWGYEQNVRLRRTRVVSCAVL